MLHELLLALNGTVGGLFVERDGVVKVLSVSFLHPGEESILNKICEHGTHYLKFQQFIRKYINFNPTPDYLPGLYVNALCYALQDEVLHDYESCLVELEEEIMMDCDTTLTYVQNKLQQFTLLFPSIAQFLTDLERKKLRGCQLLGLVTRYSSSGIPSVKSAMNMILFRLHKVMYKQLSSWLLHGTLLDPYSEFFVHKVKRAKPLTHETSSNQDDELGIGGITGEQLRSIQKSTEEVDDDDGESEDALEQFSLRVEMIPSHIPTRVLHKIIFIGESVNMFENNENLDTRKSILKDKATEYSEELYTLSEQPTFQSTDFEKMIDSIRSCVTERLWEFIVIDSDLRGVLSRLKNIFLLGRGDLHQSLIESADLLLSCPPTPMTTHDANRLFHQVLRGHNFSDELYQSFSISLDAVSKTQSQPKSTQNGWSLLNVTYKPEWPLHVFFGAVALDRYNTIFRFLLSVKRVHISLHKSWKGVMSQRIAQQPDESLLMVHQLRNHMQFLIDNLQTYLQVDVIESQFKEMLERIEETRDFEVIRSAHEGFQAGLLSQCFLLNVPVSHCLNCILDNCTAFCTLMSSCDEDITTEQIHHFEAIKVMFQKQTLLLFKILTNSKTHQRNPHLVQLLLRIDYNKYFSSAGHQLGL